MKLLIGLLLIVGGIGFAVIRYRKMAAQITESQYMQTSNIKDTIDLVETMRTTDPSYRHYVELKGDLVCSAPLTSPFASRSAAYYSNRCASVSEQTSTYHDNEGNRHTRVSKHENELSREHQSTEAYIKDSSCPTPIYVNFESFGNDIDLMECCDRFEPTGSEWSNRFGSRYSRRMNMGGRFLGYHLTERFFPSSTPVYILGEVLRMGDRYVAEKAHIAQKPSKLSYKSEEQLVHEQQNAQKSALLIGGALVIAGVVMIIMQFT